MITQAEMKIIVKKVLDRLNQIKERMNRYEKFRTLIANWGEVQFDANAFVKELEKEIHEINNCVEAYTRPDLQVVYATKNYDSYIAKIETSLKIYEKKFEHFLKFEHLPYYYKEEIKIDEEKE